MTTTAVRTSSESRMLNLAEANRIKRLRVSFRGELRMLPGGQARALFIDALNEMPEWLAGAEAHTALSWIPRIGDSLADQFLWKIDVTQRKTLRELTPRQVRQLADALIPGGGR